MTANRKSSRSKSPLKPKLIAALFILPFAVVGSYLLLRSHAAIPDNDFRGNGGLIADYSVYSDTQNPNEKHAVGTTFKRNYYLYFPSGGTYPSGTHHIQFYVRWYTKEVKHLANKFNCGDVTPCVKVSTPGYTEHPSITNLIYCFEVTPAMRSQGNVRLFSTEFQQLSATAQNWFDDILYLFDGECSGYYENGPPANDANYLGSSSLGNGSLGSGVAGQITGDDNDSSEESKKGNNGDGTGSGGGGGGSSANNNSDKPNTVPSTSSQGNKDQTELEPSPFYDGKEYAPGSDPLDKNLGNISVAGRKLAHGWVYLIAMFLAVIGGGAYYLLRVKNRGVDR